MGDSGGHFSEENGNLICDSTGMNMVMYMDGFHSIIFGGSSSCINLFFPSWTLDSKLKVFLAMSGLFLLGVCTEGVSALRLRFFSDMQPGHRKKAMIVCFHGLQAFLGYSLMLGAMTFSIELLLSVCSGLAVGYFFFFAKKQIS